MAGLPQCLTFAQAVKLSKLPEDCKVIGWNLVPPGPIVRRPVGPVRVIKPDGRWGKADGWIKR